jgi:predicted nucleic acid-binding protein
VKWLLDTNVLSEGVRKRPDPAVVSWVAARKAEDLAISSVTIAELLNGVSAMADGERRQQLMTWIASEVLNATRGRTLPVTTEILVTWLQLSQKLRVRRETRDPADLLLAATAEVFELTLATRNVRHFAFTGIAVYNPWTGETLRMEAP